MTELHTELHDEEELTTADMAAVSDRPPTEPKTQPAAVEREAAPVAPDAAPGSEMPATPLFAEHEAQELRSCWDDIQAAFVDEPRRAVEKADHLVAQTIKQLAEGFARERQQLEQQWSRGDQVSTEDLRIALQRYRSFFGRLLSL